MEAIRRLATVTRGLGLAPAPATAAPSTVAHLGAAPGLAHLRIEVMTRGMVLPRAAAMVPRVAVTAPAMAAALRVAAMPQVMVPPKAVAMVPSMVPPKVVVMTRVMVGPRVVATVPAMGVLRVVATDQVTAAPRVAAMARAMADRGITAPMIGMTEIAHPAAVGSIR